MENINRVLGEINKVIIGKEEVVKKIMTAILAKGHILMEDVPGVGKTSIAVAFSKALSLSEGRLQFTPDVLPSDVVGFSVYNKASGAFEYKEGAVMCNIFLADEINRTSPKTQSALLEVMEEGNVTVDGVTRELPNPFIVIATQNPMGSIGTQALPESQLDRFMIKLSVGYPDRKSEIDMLKSKTGNVKVSETAQIIDRDELLRLQRDAESVFIDDSVYEYIIALVAATRENPLLKLGLSPRAAISFAAMARAAAFLCGRDYVIPDDAAEVFPDIAAHRLVLSPAAKMGGRTPEDILSEIIGTIKMPGIKKAKAVNLR